MDVSATTWNTLSELLDEALDLEPAARAQWIERLDQTQPALALSVRKLLSAHASSETADVLAELPALSTLLDTAVRVPGLAANDRVGPYRLKRELGSGGMADVWLAERADGAFTREVALKLPLVNRMRRDLAQRFARERDILARLEHPHIARLYDAGVSEDGLSYLAMEYVDGWPVTQYCDARRLELPERLHLFVQVLDAVQYAHANLIIHRDLKPSNILSTADGQARLLDFGIAKLLQGETTRQTQLTQLAGRALTPDYASPEQIKGEPLTIATDVYSLGVVLHELLTGQRPYKLKFDSVGQLELAIISTDPSKPSTTPTVEAALLRSVTPRRLARALSGDLDTIVLKALAKSPTERYATIAEFAQDLQRHLEGRPVLARPASTWYRLSKFVTRYRWTVGGVSAAALALIVFALFAVAQARQARIEANKAQAVKSFLTTLFATNNIEQSQGAARRQLSAQQLLEDGARRVGSQFADQPELRADLQGVIGQLLHDLAQSNQALTVREQRLNALEQAGASRRDKAVALKEIADTLLQKGDEAGARARLAAAVELLSGSVSFGDQVEYWALRSAFGRLHLPTSDRNAGRMHIELAAEKLSALAPDSLQYAMALFVLGDLRSIENKLDEATPLFEQSMAQQERLLGPKSFKLAQLRYALATSLAGNRRYAEAISQLIRALEVLEETAGPEHPSTGLVHLFLGRLRSIRGETEAGRLHLRRALAIFEKRVDDVAPLNVASAHLYLGESLLDEGRVTEASGPLETAMDLHAAISESIPKSVAAGIFARYLLDTGRYAQAEATLVHAREQRIAVYEATHPAVASLMNRIGIVQQAAGALQKAEATFRSVEQSQPQRETVFGSPRHLAQMNLAALEMERGNYAAVIAPLRRMHEAFYRLPEAEHNRVTELHVNLRLARALVGAGQATEAEPLLARASGLGEPLYEHSPLRIQLNCTLARYFAAIGDKRGARERIEIAKKSLAVETALGPHFERTVLAAEADVRKSTRR